MRQLSCTLVIGLCSALSAACGSNGSGNGETPRTWECLTSEGDDPDALAELGCESDFRKVAVEATDSSLPGAVSVKTIIDRVDENRLYFQNSAKYPLHYDYASAFLSAVDDLPVVGNAQSFNENYYTEQRRFTLGTVTHYEGPDKWVWEVSPYDNASVDLLVEAFEIVRKATYFGDDLALHPSSVAAESAIPELESRQVPVITTDELYEGIDYQPLTLGRSCGKLVFYRSEELETNFLSYQDIVVLDAVPNDISVTQGLITEEFQTPLSHVNVLSQNRGTPNMALRGAFDSPDLRRYEGQWVTLEVRSNGHTLEPSDPQDSADCLVQPEPIEVTGMNLSVTELTDVVDIYDPESDVGLKEQVRAAVPAFGGKASHYSALSRVEGITVPSAFVIPVYFYNQFMVENGFDLRVTELLADADFKSDAAVRDAELEKLREDMLAAPINEDFLTALYAKLEAEYPGVRMRFRSSTNAEDLGDFTGAGLYTSMSGMPGSDDEPVETALRTVWSSIWYFRAFEERAYRGIDHQKVGMALLAHHSFPEEEANGVAVTANPFDASGVEPGFYVNVQVGNSSVVSPPRGITTDQYVHYYEMRDKPVVFLEHSNLVPDGQNVLTPTQINDLGAALKAIHQHFYQAYGSDNDSGWYGMDVEFKFDGEIGEDAPLHVKQARPYPDPF